MTTGPDMLITGLTPAAIVWTSADWLGWRVAGGGGGACAGDATCTGAAVEPGSLLRELPRANILMGWAVRRAVAPCGRGAKGRGRKRKAAHRGARRKLQTKPPT